MLVSLLSDRDPGVSANAAGTIMNTAVITKGTILREKRPDDDGQRDDYSVCL